MTDQPLCMYTRKPCWRHGQIQRGPAQDDGQGWTRESLLCLTCGCRGDSVVKTKRLEARA